MTWSGPELAGFGRRAQCGRRAPRGRRAVAATAAVVVGQVAAAAAVALAAPGCDGSTPPTRQAPSAAATASAGAATSGAPAATKRATIRVTVRDVVLDVEVADTPDRQVRGLSGRESLAPRSGMLFSFGIPTSGGFYMFRTRMPLSIMFVGEGDRVVDVTEMAPCLTDLPTDCPVYYSSAPYTYAVEAAAGTFTDAGVGPGDVVSVGA